ncbi:DoxX family protein [Micromonospora globbae]|uniref:DoxX family protein n=1 Tax=Micromonospora globbae TaxID=1894969 RepID=A0ABZ1SF18_9ACTN|nr:DoxX family protein [Micromonospora globbae]
MTTKQLSPGRVRHLRWIPQVPLALAMVAAGTAKLGGNPAMVAMFDDIGAGQWFRYAVGALEVAGGVGLVIPRLAGYAALGLVCLLAGAVVTNVAVLRTSPVVALAHLAAAVLVAWLRRPPLVSRSDHARRP